MFNAIRKNQKKIMAVLGVFLMIAFIADLGIRNYGPAQTNSPMGAYIGDQPLLSPELCRGLLGAPLDEARPLVAPRYGAGGGRNPVRVERFVPRASGRPS